MAARGPTTELGATNSFASALPGWNFFVDEQERVPELMWPDSINVYNRMRNDPQIAALFAGVTLPIRRYKWFIDPNGAKTSIVKAVAEDLGLPVLGQQDQTRPRRKGRFSHEAHLRHALLGLLYGHMFFEQVGVIQDDKWRLRKLAPRMPYTIGEISVARDGGLNWIKQNVDKAQQIPVDRLVAYVNDREGGNWIGRSVLRSCYQPWLIKDRLLRVDAIRHERNGMGVPIVELPERATEAQRRAGNELAQQYKVGEASGGAVPAGMRLRLVGTEGSISDVLASIKYHDESMARAFLEMFIQLGVTKSGSRALGEAFIDFFSASQETIADWYADTTNEHVIEDWVDLNYGDGEQAPLIAYDKDSEPELAMSDFINMVDKGMITVDKELEDWLRDRYNMPERDEDTIPPVSVPVQLPAAPAESTPPALPVAAAGSPEWPYRRQLKSFEVQAATDFRTLDLAWQGRLERLLAEWEFVQAAQIDDLVRQVESATTIDALANILTTHSGAENIALAMHEMVEQGAAAAAQEAAAQGQKLPVPDLEMERGRAVKRAAAVDRILRQGLSQSARAHALRLSADGRGGAEVAAGVKENLLNLSGKYLQDQLGGTLTQAQNSGRRAVMVKGGAATRFYSSELLDANTCSPCAQNDGKEYLSVEDAESDYPTGGYSRCEAGPRCRGTLVAVYEEDEA